MWVFAVPGDGATLATSINRSGSVAGSNDPYGFVVDAQDLTTITAFDFDLNYGGHIVGVAGINDRGSVTGTYADVISSAAGYAFVRDALGKVTFFDVTPSSPTYPAGIDNSGAITGTYNAIEGQPTGAFVREPQGNITTFGPAGSTATYAQSINASGAITGWYSDAGGVQHGFIRDPQGNITTFDPPGGAATTPYSINYSGAITGWYSDAGGVQHGLVRDPQGNITTFDPVGSTATSPYSMNARGVITGTYSDATGVMYGFVGSVPNTVDVSNTTGSVSDAVWQNAKQAGVSNVIVQAWAGGAQNTLAEAQLLGAQSNGLGTGASILLNYFSKESAAYQVGQGIGAIGTALSNLKFVVLDVESCCGEFTSWQASTSYATGGLIKDPANHIQEVTTAGTSGPAAPAWNDAGGATSDGTVVWQDTGNVLIGKASRVTRISAAVSALEAYNLPHGVVIYTGRRKGDWQAITGDCGTGATNNCSSLIALPLWDVEHKTFDGEDLMPHCGDGIAGLYGFTPYSSETWQTRSGNQYDFGLAGSCNGEMNLFGLSGAATLNLDYFDPALFQ
jgi:hypothetical protein